MSDRPTRKIRIGDAPGGNYTGAVEVLAEQLARHGRGTVTHVEVAHDDWCALLRDGAPCNCSPEVRVLGGKR